MQIETITTNNVSVPSHSRVSIVVDFSELSINHKFVIPICSTAKNGYVQCVHDIYENNTVCVVIHDIESKTKVCDITIYFICFD